MFEFGGKVNSQVPGHKGTWITYKSYFEALGFRHVSVDFDTRFDAIKRDLRTPLWEEFGQFDMVTNIGTSEHVEGQKGCWQNVHMLTKVGGVYVGQCPYHDGRSWWWHGIYYPTEAFYESFADLNGWQIERMGTDLPEPNKNLYVRMRKVEEKEFAMPDESLIHYNVRRPR
jgi:hypothetical protein